MRRATLTFALALATLACARSAAAQATDDRRARPEKKDERTSSGGLVVPAIYYSPETKLALGIAGFYYFRLPGETLDDRPSNVDGDVIYTIKRAKVGIFRDIDYADYPWPSRRSRGGRMER